MQSLSISYLIHVIRGKFVYIMLELIPQVYPSVKRTVSIWVFVVSLSFAHYYEAS